jgi:hypothetical protein
MHIALTANFTVVFLDKVENHTYATLPNGKRAYSVAYDARTHTFVPIEVRTNAFCSGGSITGNGTIVSVGGNGPLFDIDPAVGDGFRSIRYYHRPKPNSVIQKKWIENGNRLSTARWYPSAVTLPNGDILVCSGSLNGLDPTNPANNNPTCELLDANGGVKSASKTIELFLNTQPYHMYPFMHVLPDGSIFIFAGISSRVISPWTKSTLRTLPNMPGLKRTYPNTGSSAMLMLSPRNNWTATILICGGGEYQDLTSPTDHTCGRITPLDDDPQWEMEAMPEGRTMLDLVNLFDGRVLIVNGGNQGAEGFGMAQRPVQQALYYNDALANGYRFTQAGMSDISRLYHSVAIQLPDGQVMIAGSNPNEQPVYTADAKHPFVTELRIETFAPNYTQETNRRPRSVQVDTGTWCSCSEMHAVRFDNTPGGLKVQVTVIATGFVTHSVHMSQRIVELESWGFVAGKTSQTITVRTPPNANILPNGPYLLCVLVDGVLALECVEVTFFALPTVQKLV